MHPYLDLIPSKARKVPDAAAWSKTFDEFMEGHFKETLGRSIRTLGALTAIPPDLNELLTESLRRRNWLIHAYFRERAEKFMTELGRDSMLSELQEIQDLFDRTENRNGLAVAGMISQANGTAERRASEAMLKGKAKRNRRITVGEDKAYDSRDHVAALRQINVTPHVAQNNEPTKAGWCRSSAIDKRTTRHIGYRISQSCRAMAECIFGWGKQHGTMRKTKHRGVAAVDADFMLNLIAYNLVRIPKLIAT